MIFYLSEVFVKRSRCVTVDHWLGLSLRLVHGRLVSLSELILGWLVRGGEGLSAKDVWNVGDLLVSVRLVAISTTGLSGRDSLTIVSDRLLSRRLTISSLSGLRFLLTAGVRSKGHLIDHLVDPLEIFLISYLWQV